MTDVSTPLGRDAEVETERGAVRRGDGYIPFAQVPEELVFDATVSPTAKVVYAALDGALLRARPASVVCANRTLERARQLAERHADLGTLDTCAPAEIGSRVPFELLINSTSAGHDGMAPPLSREWLTPGGLCYDLNYGAAAEPLRLACAREKIAYSDGLGMLVAQAARSFRLWTGRQPDAAAVLAELRRQH